MHDGAARFQEGMVYQGWNCLESTIDIRSVADGAIEVEQGDGSTVCCRGSLRPGAGSINCSSPPRGNRRIGRDTKAMALGGTGTQYGAFAAGSLWMPLDNVGAVARINAATGDRGDGRGR
jgi:hypothetical protein